MSPALLETQQNSLRSAPRNPHCAKTHKCARAVQYARMVVVVVVLSISPSSSDIPPAHAHPNVETHTLALKPTYMLLCLHGLASEYCGPHLHFPSMRSFALRAGRHLYHHSASAQRMSQSIFKCASENLDYSCFIYIWTAASLSNHWPIKDTHAGIVMSLTPAQPDEMKWRGVAALRQFHTAFSLVFLSQCFFIVSPNGSLRRVFNTCFFNFAVATAASAVQRESLDSERR